MQIKTKGRLLAAVLTGAVLFTACSPKTESKVLTGEAEGYGGKITATVTVTDGKITGLELVGDKETEGVGGAAMETLKDEILKAGTTEGVETIAGATWTCNGVFEAINNAMGASEGNGAEEGKDPRTVSASGLKHGAAIIGTPRLGPGKDDKDVDVYSFNEVMAYVILDKDNRIVDLEVDILEVITPNHDAADDNRFAGWPESEYNADMDGNGEVETTLKETEDYFVESIEGWQTKRMKGDAYKMNSGTWEQEMDTFEEFFKGKTVDEIYAWYETSCSDLNGRPLFGTSDKDEDVAKYEAMTDEQKAEMDALAGATMSLTDAHGDILAAIKAAADCAVEMKADRDIAKVGLGITTTPRLGPGKDDQDVPVYSYNTQVAGVCYDADGKVIDMYIDVLEVITPNHDGAEDNILAGWPGQSYNSDKDADGKVDEVLEQTTDTFQEQVKGFTTKKRLGSAYKMNSGTWIAEAEIFEDFFAGKTVEEIKAWYETSCSDLNGRPLFGTSDKEEDVAKYEAMTDEQKAEMDGLAGATMSLTDGHGDILGAIEKSYEVAKAVDIKVG